MPNKDCGSCYPKCRTCVENAKCFWCLLLLLQRYLIAEYLDEVLDTPGRTTAFWR